MLGLLELGSEKSSFVRSGSVTQVGLIKMRLLLHGGVVVEPQLVKELGVGVRVGRGRLGGARGCAPGCIGCVGGGGWGGVHNNTSLAAPVS